MRITDVIPLVMGTSWRNLIFIKVLTDEGVYGISEATIQNREEGVLGYLEGAKRRHVIGSDPFDIEDLWLRMYRNDFWRGGDIAATVMSAVEIFSALKKLKIQKSFLSLSILIEFQCRGICLF